MSINVKILKDQDGFVAGQIVSLRDKLATSLIKKNIAEQRGPVSAKPAAGASPKKTTAKPKKKTAKAKKG